MQAPADTLNPRDKPLALYDLGLSPYLPLQAFQAKLRQAVVAGHTNGALLLLEHPPVVTLGAHARPDDLTDPVAARQRGIEVVRSERGGQSTLHAPGQLVSYPVIRIPERDLRAYVRRLEDVLLHLLSGLGVSARRISGRPGVYVDGRKIASLGLKCERGVASHGSSLNVSLDLSLFDLIVSCGEPALRQTSVQQSTGQVVSMQHVKSEYAKAFSLVFGMTLAPARSLSLEQLSDALGLPD